MMIWRLGWVVCLLAVVACSSDSKPTAGTGSSSSKAPELGSAVPSKPSAACATTPTAPPPDSEATLTSGGVARTYFLHVPPSDNGMQPLPVVLDFHGYAEGASLHRTTSMLGSFGDAHGFITITPQGTGSVPRWDTTLGGDDLRFVGDLIDSIEQTLCVDERRVYATGYSNGAMLTAAIACQLSDRVAAIAPVAGIIEVTGCSPRRPVPVVAFHGTADPIVAYDGGVGPGLKNLPAPDGSGRTLGDLGSLPTFAAIPDAIAAWARLDGCDGSAPTSTTVASDVSLLSFACPAPVAVQLFRVEGGGHSWPGSQFTASIAAFVGPTTMSINADDLMWAFFQAHPLPA
jgi:polyhydroxybutyrate depolymerase